MKKSLLAAAALGTFATMAHAQSSVTVYGLVDMGLVAESGGAAGSVTKLTSGVTSGSRLGFRGQEDLGGGLSALFVLENGLNADTGTAAQGGLLFGRLSYVGLKGGFGSMTFGRHLSPHYTGLLLVADPFATGYAGQAQNLMANPNGRFNNSIVYSTPVLNHFSGQIAYSFGESAGSTSDNSGYGISLDYANGPLNVRAVYQTKDTTVGATSNDAENMLLASNYDFGPVKAYLSYGRDKGVGSSPFAAANPYGAAAAPAASTDSAALLIGVAVPVGPNTILASYIRKDDKDAGNRDADQIAIGYVHPLSKRTNLYTAYARINNKNGAAYTVNNASATGSGDKAFNLGIRHRF
ncbi:MAG TPA: porin [Noviherbaspirillum sp.]|nr:porin [Noviherbaspirillum sp.]